MDKKTIEIQKDLHKSMEQEILLMREVLSNHLEEEYFLLQKDEASQHFTIQQRLILMEKVKAIRTNRDYLTEICKEIESSCEVSLFLDQLLALADKIHLQQKRNEHLSEKMNHLIAFPSSFPYALCKTSKITDKKSTLTTLLDYE